MSKIISTIKVKEDQARGINKVADLMKITIGPRGRNVSLTNGETVNDGGRIAQDITLKDPLENKGASRIKAVVKKTSEDVGGGRTATAIIFQELVNEGLKLLDKGMNVNLLRHGMNEAVKDINAQLTKMAKPATGQDILKVATISTENEELGKVIADTIKQVGKDGVVSVEEGQTLGISADIVEGLKFDKGYISPYMMTNPREEAEYKNVPILITDKKIFSYKEFFPVINRLTKAGKNSLIIVAEDVEGDALNNFLVNKIRGAFNILAIKAPSFGENKANYLEDIAQAVGAEVVSEKLGTEWINAKLGSAKKVLSTSKTTTIFEGAGNLKNWLTTLNTRKEIAENKWEKDQLMERIARLSQGMAVIKVGANSESEIKYLKLKIEDGVNEAKRALEEGVIVGGDVAFVNAVKCTKVTVDNKEIQLGYDLVLKAIEAPLRQIVINSKGSPDVVINEILDSSSPTIGYDSLQNKVIPDMYKEGIIDAVKVPKTVLQNAVGEAGMFLTIDGDVSDLIEETK